MATTLMTTIVADVAPPEMRSVKFSKTLVIVYLIATRSSAFFYRFTSELIAECLVPPVASLLMKRNLWTPLIIAIGFMTVGTFMILIVPETIPYAVEEPLVDVAASNGYHPEIEPSGTEEEPLVGTSKPNEKWKDWMYASKEFFAFVIRDKLVVALLVAFPLLRIGRQAYHMFLQYVSIRYHWSLAQVGSYPSSMT